MQIDGSYDLAARNLSFSLCRLIALFQAYPIFCKIVDASIVENPMYHLFTKFIWIKFVRLYCLYKTCLDLQVLKQYEETIACW